MGKRIIDHWTQRMVNSDFVWGLTDCHQLLYEFVKLNNPQWSDPRKIGVLRGTYSTWREANSIAKELRIPEWLEELGYVMRPVNRVEAGDIVAFHLPNRAYDMYMPVVFGQTVLVGDAKSRKIRLRHINEFNRDYVVFRRQLCQEQ